MKFRKRISVSGCATLTYDRFILSLDLLFALNTIHLNDGLIAKANNENDSSYLQRFAIV